MGIFVFLLLNYPLVQIFNLDYLLGGFPLLVFHLHAVWLLAIAWLYVLSRLISSRE